MVVLIAGISYLGHFAMRIVGNQHGPVLTGNFCGLISSTARDDQSVARVLKVSRHEKLIGRWNFNGLCYYVHPLKILEAKQGDAKIF